MPEHKHTPGPWSVAGVTIYSLNKNEVNRFDARVQQGWDDSQERTSRAECEANARLIAAAPDLLEALEAMLEAYDDGVGKDWERPYWLKAHAAIAKATGQA